jgi:CheY-like chemotaxis protein
VGAGTGLGLSQVYGFSRQAGGDVRIASEPGNGTSVEILLPLVEGKAAEPAATVPAPQARAGGEVVLVVEDQPGVLEMAVASLHELGYVTLQATTAQEALAHLRRDQRIDVLFSDVVMPGGMNGIELSAAARQIRPDLRVLLTSGFTGQERQPDAELLSKPYDQAQLALRLRAVLG